tara:strand:- start:658 stop:1485 length:828 start_codon:yes stop_codon:yes gene_type:complete
MKAITYERDWTDLQSDMANAKTRSGWDSLSSASESDPVWAGSRTWDDAVHMLTYGWTEGRSKLAQAAEYSAPMMQRTRQPRYRYSPAGGTPHVPNVCLGVPNVMRSRGGQAGNAQAPVVRIAVNIGALCSIDPQDIINRGGALIALIDNIEAGGQRVELEACTRSKCDDNETDLRVRIMIKRAADVLSLDRIAFALASPSMLRRVEFRIMEITLPKHEYGYGSPRDFDEDDFPANTMYLPRMEERIYETEERAVRHVQRKWDEAKTEWQQERELV